MEGKRQEKKSKLNIKIWLPILCVAVVVITFYMIHDIQKRIDEVNQLKENDVVENEQNTVQNEVAINQTVIENSIVENEITNQIQNTVVTNTSNTTKNNTSSNAAVTDLKQRAIELVQKEWGKDDSVNFSFDYVNENGEYVIAVKDRQSATVKCYFRVNLESGIVELD